MHAWSLSSHCKLFHVTVYLDTRIKLQTRKSILGKSSLRENEKAKWTKICVPEFTGDGVFDITMICNNQS